MHRTTAICALLALFAPATPALAADDAAQIWASVNVAAPVATDLSALWEGSYRLREGSGHFLTRATLDWEADPGVKIGGGMTFAQSGSISELRPHQQITFSTGRLTLRTRMEERWFDGSPRAQLRLRQRVQYGMPLAPGLKAAVAAEVLYALQWQKPGRQPALDQWRLNATVTRRLSSHADVMAGYMMIATPVPLAQDRRAHVAQLTLTYHP